jgi:hypothetical protein
MLERNHFFLSLINFKENNKKKLNFFDSSKKGYNPT